MTCPDKSTLMLWLDGEMSPSEADSVTEHLKNCSVCREYISAQKQLESLWRESWTDPPEEAFSRMRSSIAPVTPWWKTPSTWYIAAAVCAAYIGVKIFYIDGAGTSLSSLALEETTLVSEPLAETSSCVADDSPVEEMTEEEREEVQDQTEQIIEPETPDAVEQDEAAEQEGLPAEEGRLDIVVNQPSSVSRLNAGGSDEQTVLSEGVPGESSVGDLYAEPADEETVLGGVVSAGEATGLVAGSSAYTAAGGGGSSGSIQLNSHESSDDAEAEEVFFAAAPAQDGAFQNHVYSVAIALESGEVFNAERESWPSLFDLIDTLSTKNGYSVSESIVIRVGSDGSVSGDGIQDGIVIDIPGVRYGNCEVTVSFD